MATRGCSSHVRLPVLPLALCRREERGHGEHNRMLVKPYALSFIHPAPSSSCFPGAEHLCPAPAGFFLLFQPLLNQLFPRIQPYRIQPCSVCTEAEITAAPFQQGGDNPACCNYQIRQQPPKSSSRTWRSQPGLSEAARCSWHRLRSCPPLFLAPPAPSRNSSKGFPCTGQGEELLLC